MRNVIVATGIGVLLLFSIVIAAQAKSPLGPHCIGAGPLSLTDPDFCGCTWGEIYFEGDPLEDIEVVLSFGDQLTTTHTVKQYNDELAFFSMSGAGLGAKRGDIMTLTVTMGEQTVSRVFRALPDANGEQHVPIVVPATRTKKSLNLSGYTSATALYDDMLWSGGEAGLLSLNLTTNQTQTYTLPWSTQVVQDIEIASSGAVWVLGETELATLNGAAWQTYTVPITSTLYDIAINQQTSDIWVGGGQDRRGTIARLSAGIWQETETFPAAVRTIAFSEQNAAWVGTWSKGVYRQANNGNWTQYTTADGLASDYVYDIESNKDIESNGSTIWFGTRPYLGADGYFGGLSRYDVAADTWHTFTTQDGLPVDPIAPDLGDQTDLSATDNIYDLISEKSGLMWVGSTTGVYREIQPGKWVAVRDTSTGGRVSDIVFTDDHLAIAAANGVSLLSPLVDAGNSPTVTSIEVDDGPEVWTGGSFVARATVNEMSDVDDSIIGWEWSSDLDGPLCTTINVCEFDGSELTLGEHTLSVRVQNQSGRWSPLLSKQIKVVETNIQYINLPIVLKASTAVSSNQDTAKD